MIGTTFNQRFTLEKELGRGGMGTVYRATDQVLQRNVAIKLLKEHGGEEVGRQLRLEAQILARLLHENVVRLYDFGEADGTYFLIMEEVEGSSFNKRWRLLPLPERIRIVVQTADALDYAHHQGVIHRDVKPANVLLTATDQAKLSDFGLSLLAEQAQESDTVRGTPHYMSPEQALGKKIDHRSDLYALGVMLYECVTGTAPFLGTSMSIVAQHVKTPPEPPRVKNPEISEDLDALVLKLLAKDPEARYHSGAEVAAALRAVHAWDPLRPSATVVLPPGAAAGGLAPSEKPTVEAAPPRVPPPPPPAASPLARELLAAVLEEPIFLTPDDRYLCGHYLAYLLGGARRRGFLLRRPLDPRNADRARLLLAITYAMLKGGTPEAVARAAELLEERPEVRSALNPIVVVKYLVARDTPAKLKRFRQVRRQLGDASPYARKHMADANGVLNPGMIPQRLADLRRVAPVRTEVDDLLVSRWNRVAEVWRGEPDFREAVLRYATAGAHRDSAAADLWPEVVYPLIERARWQRQFRPRHEALWDYLCDRVLHVPDAGTQLDRAINRAVPEKVVDELDLSVVDFLDEPRIEDDPSATSQDVEIDRLTARLTVSGVKLQELADDRAPDAKDVMRLLRPEPMRFTQGELRALWQEAVAALGTPGAKTAHRHVPLGGPYRLAVIPSVRGRSAGQVVIQGMPNKQVEMLTPSLRVGGSDRRPVLAVWVYQDASLAAAYLDFQHAERFILWHAPNAQQFNFEDPADLNHMLFNLGLEGLEQLDTVLSKRYRPKDPV